MGRMEEMGSRALHQCKLVVVFNFIRTVMAYYSTCSQTLRQTLLSYAYGDTMVFERGEHITAFRQRCSAARPPIHIPQNVKLVALDGRGSFNIGRIGATCISQIHLICGNVCLQFARSSHPALNSVFFL